MNSNVIRPLEKKELETLFDSNSVEVMEFFLKELLLTKPEVLPKQDDVPIYAAQEYVEQWFVQALGARPMGAGSYPIDILKDGEYGADIKSLTYKCDEESGELLNRQSGEASLGQKFDTDSDEQSLDGLFNENKREDILNLWKGILENKYKKVQKNELEGLALYFFFILRGPKDFYLVAGEVDPENVQDLSVNTARSTKDSVFVDGYIDSEYGSCKIYKAKKRMELRLLPKKWIDEGKCLKFDIPQERIEVNLRELSEKGELSDYLEQKFKFVKTSVEELSE